MRTPGNTNRPEENQKNNNGDKPDETTPRLDPPEEGDLTPEDMEALGPVDLSLDGGEDEQLKHREHPVDFSGEDLDIPGSELDDASEDIGSEDEENNNYSMNDDNGI